MLASSVVFRGFVPGLVKSKIKINICCFSTKHAVLRSKRNDWSALNQDNVSEWEDMSTRRLLSQ
jgi:hypothetical protein